VAAAGVILLGLLLPFRAALLHASYAAVVPARPEPLAIVVNRSNPVTNLSIQELRSIFLSERSYWPNGRRITLVLREPGDPEREAVLRGVCNMDENQFQTHILHGLYTGEINVSPKMLNTPNGVRRFIFNVPGAIGSLRLSEVDDTVSTIRIDGHLPGDKDYPLHVYSGAEKTE
jgi:ABC-type phosphate transport system substrate-binding protein